MKHVMHAQRPADDDPHHLDDQALVDAVASHRSWALAEVYRRHGAAVHGLALRLCEPCANQLTEDVFVAFWLAGARDEMFVSSIGDHLLADAHERCLASLRTDRAHQGNGGVVDAKDLEARLLEPWAHDRFGGVLADLAADERRAFCFAELAGYSDAEIAALWGWTLESTEHHLSDARRRVDALFRCDHTDRPTASVSTIDPGPLDR